MSVRIMLIGASDRSRRLGELDTLAEAIDDVHQHWLESPAGRRVRAPGRKWVRTRHDDAVSGRLRGLYYRVRGRRLESHRCRSVLDRQRRYVRTEVTALIRVGDAEVVIP